MTGSNLATVAEAECLALAAEPPIARPLVVVIEDDYRSSMALTMLIDDWGYSCIAARSSREAVKTLGNRLPHISAIVTDVEIEGEMTGIRDALAIASTLGRPVPTIVATGHSEFAVAVGPFTVIRKPFDPDILYRWLVHKLGYAPN